MKKKRDKVERAGNTFPQHLSLAHYPHLLLCFSLTPVCTLKCEWKFQGNLEAESCIPRPVPLKNRMLWWLSLCVNLTGLRDNQRAGKTIFLGGICEGCLQQRLAFELVDWVKKMVLMMQVGISQQRRTWREQKVEEGLLCPLAWAETSIFFCPGTLAHLVLRPSNLDCITPQAF